MRAHQLQRRIEEPLQNLARALRNAEGLAEEVEAQLRCHSDGARLRVRA